MWAVVLCMQRLLSARLLSRAIPAGKRYALHPSTDMQWVSWRGVVFVLERCSSRRRRRGTAGAQKRGLNSAVVVCPSPLWPFFSLCMLPRCDKICPTVLLFSFIAVSRLYWLSWSWLIGYLICIWDSAKEDCWRLLRNRTCSILDHLVSEWAKPYSSLLIIVPWSSTTDCFHSSKGTTPEVLISATHSFEVYISFFNWPSIPSLQASLMLPGYRVRPYQDWVIQKYLISLTKKDPFLWKHPAMMQSLFGSSNEPVQMYMMVNPSINIDGNHVPKSYVISR
jgi:hypothetical protein